MNVTKVRVVRVSKGSFIFQKSTGELPEDDTFEQHIEYAVNRHTEELSEVDTSITNVLHTVVLSGDDEVHYYSIFYSEKMLF